MAPPRPYFRLIKESYVKPASVDHASDEIPLHGVDAMIGHLNMRLVYFFESLLPVEALKASLSEALVSFPLFSGRSRVSKGRHYMQLNGAGALVREQVVTFYGHDEGLDSPALRPYLDGFAGPERFAKAHNGHMLTVTFTEIAHAESFFSCAPPAACKGGLEATKAEDWTGKRPIKYALGVSASHGVADGSSVAQFLLNWAMVSCGGKRLPLAPFQRAALAPPPEKEPPRPAHIVQVGPLGRLNIMAATLFSEYTYTNCSLYFSEAELEALKARCMAPLEGTDLWVTTSNSLAAHCWPIISSLIMGHDKKPARDRPLCPMVVVFNCRKALGLPPNFFANCASFNVVEDSRADEDPTALALKIRKVTSAVDGDRLRSEYQFMQKKYEQGEAQAWMHRLMRDGLLGSPFMGWDDVSGFQPPPDKNGSGGGVAFAGVRPVVIDFHPSMWFPGMTFVLPAPHGNQTGGKEVLVCLTRRQAKKLISPEWQERIHCYRPEEERQQPQGAGSTNQEEDEEDDDEEEELGGAEETKDATGPEGASGEEGAAEAADKPEGAEGETAPTRSGQ